MGGGLIRVDFQLISSIFEEAWRTTQLSTLTLGLKGMCITFVIIRFTYLISRDVMTQKKLGDSAEPSLPITPGNLLYYAGLVALIASYDYLLMGLDVILSFAVSKYQFLDATNINPDLQMEATRQQGLSIWEVAMETFLEILAFLTNPLEWLMVILRLLVWIFDQIAYALFVTERFMVMTILKLTGPLALAMSILPRMQHVAFKWLSLYMRWFLLIIPYFIVNMIAAGFFEAWQLIFYQNNALSGSMLDPMKWAEVIFLLLMAGGKFIGYRAGKQIYNELFNIDFREKE